MSSASVSTNAGRVIDRALLLTIGLSIEKMLTVQWVMVAGLWLRKELVAGGRKISTADYELVLVFKNYSLCDDVVTDSHRHKLS